MSKDIFWNQTLLELIDCLFYFIQMKMAILKDLKLEDITYQKALLIIIKSSSIEKDFYGQAIDSDVKWYEEIKKLTTGRSEDYTTECLLDYDDIKNHYKSIAVDLSRQKELEADPKAIQQIEFIGQWKRLNVNNNNDQFMFVLTILEKNKETRLKFLQGSVTVL